MAEAQDPVTVLVVGRNPAIMTRILAQLRNAGFQPTGVLTEDDALRELRLGSYTVITIGGGVAPAVRARLHREAALKDPAPLVLDIMGPETVLPRLEAVRAALPRQ